MDDKLKDLIARFKNERKYRDSGAAAKKTYVEIKALATPDELIAFFEEMVGFKAAPTG